MIGGTTASGSGGAMPQHNATLNKNTGDYRHLTAAQLDALIILLESGTTSITEEQVKILYEHNPDTNVLNDARRDKLDALVSNATLYNRTNHTGTQTASTISDFNTAVALVATLKANNLSELVDKANARLNLGIDKVTPYGNSNITMLSTDRIVQTNATFTANRTWTLPTGLLAGREIIIDDYFGSIGSYVLNIIPPAGKKLNGIVDGIETIRSSHGQRKLIADGYDNFTFDAGVQRVILNKTVSTTTYTLLDSDTNYFLLFSNSCVVTVPSGLSNIQFQGMQIGYNLSVSFVAGSGITVTKPASENAITAEQFSVFGIRYLYGTTYSLYGRLQQI